MIDVSGRHVRFLCDFGPAFTGADFRGVGVGGTESCVVLLAEELARRGARVVVANNVTDVTSERGVTYQPLHSPDAGPSDIVVLWKHWSDVAVNHGGRKIFLWTDVHVTDPRTLRRAREWADISFTLSRFQYERLLAVSGRDKLLSLDGAPIAVDDYAGDVAKKEPLLLYCSVPDRGLYYLKELFPRIRRRVPEARLAITSDFSLWGAQPAKASFQRFFEGHEAVDYFGHVSRHELVALQRRARVMAYPCNFPEGFCLAAAECCAAAAVPVTTKGYALVESVADGGVLIPGHPRGWLYRRRFVRACVELLTDDARWQAYAERGRRRALDLFAPARVLDRLLQSA
jgi:glycosyltransferase involved in cell wall biosynthesis